MRYYGKARKRKIAGQMNKLEARYAEHLEMLRIAGALQEWHYERVTLKLADDTRLTVDFFVVLADGTCELHETKGGLFRDDAKVKLKVAATMFPFVFRLVRWVAGSWDIKEVGALDG